MTVAVSERTVSYTTTGSNVGPFSVPYGFYEIAVYLDGVLQSPSLYTITQATPGGTGSVTFLSAPAAGTLSIIGATVLVQSIDFTYVSEWEPETVERGLDRLTMILQEQDKKIGVGLRLPLDQPTPDPLDFLNNPNTILVSNADGEPELLDPEEVVADFAALTSTVTAAQAAAAASATAAAASASSAASSASAVAGIWLFASLYGFTSTNTAAANATALQAAVDGAAASGGVVVLPYGTFNCNPVTAAGNGVTVRGQGMFGGTKIRLGSTTGGFITFTGQHSGIENVYISGDVIKCTAHRAITINGGFRNFIRSVRIDYTYDGIRLINVNEPVVENIQLRYLLGPNGILFEGTSGAGVYGAKLMDIDADNPYNVAATIAAIKSWANSTAYSVGDIVRVNSIIWQCSSAGTSSGGGSGPTGTPGTTGANAFTTAVVDGTAQWKFIAHGGLTWCIADEYCYSLSIDNSALIGGYHGLDIRDTTASGTSQPKWFNSYGLEVDHSYSDCVVVNGGEGIYFTQGWFGSSLTGRGCTLGATCRGEVLIGEGTRIMGNALDGVLVQGGPRWVKITACDIFLNSQASAGTYNGITLAASVGDVIISNNNIGAGYSGSGSQAYGVDADATANNFVIIGNIIRGNATGPKNIGVTSSTRVYANNIE